MDRHSTFHFKKFSVRHLQSMKVGTDSVLLGAWADVDVASVHTVLDVGAGSGLLALMMAQRCAPGARIDAVELDAPAAEEARHNFLQSPWAGCLRLFEADARTWQPPCRYDLIISNPPFFERSLPPPALHRANARHARTLHAADIIALAGRHLQPAGRLCVVLPVPEGERTADVAAAHGLHLTRKTVVKSRATRPAERLLLEYGKEAAALRESELVLYGTNNTRSEAYARLTAAFYAKP
jgi:tRNA1Val (adenine37-N6)-methyltransferase